MTCKHCGQKKTEQSEGPDKTISCGCGVWSLDSKEDTEE